MRILTIPGKPLSVNHLYSQSKKTGRRFLTAAGKAWKRDVALRVIDLYGRRPLEGRILLCVTYHFPDMRRRDVTNYDKAILDALKGIMYKDDSQIDFAHFSRGRVDRKNPSMAILIWERDEEKALMQYLNTIENAILRKGNES